jgi:predicted tellurium resistance membrane protein TerC
MGKPHEFQMGYFTGSLLAALVLMSLVFVVARWEGLMTKIEKIRAIIIIIVGIKILIQGLRQYIGPVLRFFTPLMP